MRSGSSVTTTRPRAFAGSSSACIPRPVMPRVLVGRNSAPAGASSGRPFAITSTRSPARWNAAQCRCSRASATSWPLLRIVTSGREAAVSVRSISDVLHHHGVVEAAQVVRGLVGALGGLGGNHLELEVFGADRIRVAAPHDLALVQPDAVVAHLADRADPVADDDDRARLGDELLHLVVGLAPEMRVSGGQRLVDEQHVRLQVGGDGEGEPADMPMKSYSSGMYGRLAFAVSTHLEPDVL